MSADSWCISDSCMDWTVSLKMKAWLQYCLILSNPKNRARRVDLHSGLSHCTRRRSTASAHCQRPNESGTLSCPSHRSPWGRCTRGRRCSSSSQSPGRACPASLLDDTKLLQKLRRLTSLNRTETPSTADFDLAKRCGLCFSIHTIVML